MAALSASFSRRWRSFASSSTARCCARSLAWERRLRKVVMEATSKISSSSLVIIPARLNFMPASAPFPHVISLRLSEQGPKLRYYCKPSFLKMEVFFRNFPKFFLRAP